MFYLLSILFYIVVVQSIDVRYVNTIESSNSGFGKSVDMYNNTLVVGTVGRYSNTGNYATIYQKNNNTWDITNNLELSQNGWFGYAVSVNNQHCAIGGYAADKIYMYKKNDENTYTSQLQQTLKQTSSHEYGKSVSLSENYMIVGAPSSNNYAYIYQLQDDKYTMVRSITEYTTESLFGISVDITDEYAVVGSTTKAFLFINNQNNWNNVLVFDDYTDQTNFGCKVALTNDYVVVSAYGSRKVFIFDKNHDGSWNKNANVIIDQYTSESEFGYSFSIYNDMLLVAARGTNTAYLFENIRNISSVFVIDEFNDQTGFGNDVALTDTDIVITSSTQSKVYLFNIGYDSPTSGPTQTPTINPTQTPTINPTQTPTVFVQKYVLSSTPTSSPTVNTAIMTVANHDYMNGYIVVMGISIGLMTIFILCMFYIIRKYKKYNSVHIEEKLTGSLNFTSVCNMEHDGWDKTVHPIHVQYDSDEESQIIAPIHEKYKQNTLLPV